MMLMMPGCQDQVRRGSRLAGDAYDTQAASAAFFRALVVCGGPPGELLPTNPPGACLPTL